MAETTIPGAALAAPPAATVLTQEALMRMSPAQRKKYMARMKASMPPVNAQPAGPDMMQANTVLSPPGGY